MTDSSTPKSYKVLELVPSPGHASKPSELIQIRGHDQLSLNARRAITILWHNAHRQGIEKGKRYIITIASLMPQKHKGYEMVVEAVEALMKTLIVITRPNGDTERVQVLGGNNMSAKNRPAGTFTYRFDDLLIEILQDSTVWGRISLPELMAFSSKYTISLYEHVSQWIGLNYKTSQTYGLEEFRALLGIEADRYKLFGALNQQVLKPVVSELNALAPFNVSVLPIKTGKKVSHIRLSWWDKTETERKDAYHELNRSRVGRKARISGRVEYVFPATRTP